jgi:hypothetical protein
MKVIDQVKQASTDRCDINCPCGCRRGWVRPFGLAVCLTCGQYVAVTR